LEIATNGTLDLQNGTGLGGSGTVRFTGGLLRFSSNSVADLSARIVNSTGAMRIDTGTNTVNFASGLASNNTGGLTKTGSGTLVLSGTNAYTGNTTISAGVMAISNGTLTTTNANVDLDANTGLTAGSGAVLNMQAVDLNVGQSGSANFRVNGGTVNVGANSLLGYGLMLSRNSNAVSSLLVESGTLTALRIGIGRHQANFQNAGTGSVQWSGGTIGNLAGQDLLINSYDITDNYGLEINLTGSGTKTLTADSGRTIRVGPNSTNTSTGATQNTSGAYFTGSTGTLLLDGAGTVELYKTNSYNGTIQVNAGTLKLISGNATFNSVTANYTSTIGGTSSTVGIGGGTVDLGGQSNTVGSLVLTAGTLTNGTLTAGSYDLQNGTVSAALAGSSGVIKSGVGTVTLSGANTYTGDTTISNGAIALTSSGALRFVIGGSGTNNALKGNGATSVNGQFVFDLSGASTNTNATWTIVAGTLTNTYGTDFLVTGFSGSGGNWTKTTNGVTYQFVQSTGVLSVLGSTPVSAYDSWLTNYSLSGTDAVGTADPDNDGFNNNMEFAFGTIPTAGSPALLRTATSGGQFVISWLQRIDSSLNYIVEESTDLVADSWVTSSARVQSGSGATPPDGYEWKQISVTPTGKKFYRVQATIAP
jgi:autotransporter-associated beta strand protein